MSVDQASSVGPVFNCGPTSGKRTARSPSIETRLPETKLRSVSGNEALLAEVRELRINQVRLEQQVASLTAIVLQLQEERRCEIRAHPANTEVRLQQGAPTRTYAMIASPPGANLAPAQSHQQGPRPVPRVRSTSQRRALAAPNTSSVKPPVAQLADSATRNAAGVTAIQPALRPAPLNAPNNAWKQVNRKRRLKKRPVPFAAAYAKQAPLDEVAEALIGGKVPRHRPYQSIFVTNLGRRCAFDVIRQTLKRAGISPAVLLHLAWFGDSTLHIVTFQDCAEDIMKAMSDKLRFNAAPVINAPEALIALHLKEQSAKATRFSIQGFFKRRFSETTGVPLDFVPDIKK
jgi:hypothetical protein